MKGDGTMMKQVMMKGRALNNEKQWHQTMTCEGSDDERQWQQMMIDGGSNNKLDNNENEEQQDATNAKYDTLMESKRGNKKEDRGKEGKKRKRRIEGLIVIHNP